MRYFRIFIHLILIISTPTLFAYSPQVVSYVQKVHSKKLDHNFKHKETYHLISYDTTLELLNEIESGKAEKKYRKKDLKKIDAYLAYLAGQGMLPNSNAFALRDDIEDLLRDDHNDCGYTFLSESEYSIIPAIYHDEADFTLCGSWFKKKGKKAKRFVKKHKKEIIIGAVIVVATAVVVVAVIGATSAGAAAAAGTAGAAAFSSSDKEKSIKEESPSISSIPAVPPSIITVIEEAPILTAAIDEHVCSFKEFLLEDAIVQQSSPLQTWDDLSFGEKARELGAFLAHEAYKDVSELVSVIPQLCEEIKDISSQILPEDLSLSNDDLCKSPSEINENLMAKCHEMIDAVFSSDQADLYSSETEATDLKGDFAIGMIPLPGMISRNGAINAKGFSKLGRVADRAGFTKAGRGLMKHGYREERTVFQKPVGNPAQINEHGQKVLDKILNHPEKKVVQYTHKLHGPVIEIEAPELGGARFTGDGKEMMGFLEPKWFKQ